MGKRSTHTMPIELLRDKRGIYGIGITEPPSGSLDRSCGIDSEETYFRGGPPRPLILRPDCLERAERAGAALQKIVGGFRHGPFNIQPRKSYGDASTTKRWSAPDCGGLLLPIDNGGPTIRCSKRTTVAFFMACACRRSALSTA